MPRARRIARIAETQSPPRLLLGYGYNNPYALQAEYMDQRLRPAMRGDATLAGQFPSEAALARAEPVFLNDTDGSLLPLTGSPWAG